MKTQPTATITFSQSEYIRALRQLETAQEQFDRAKKELNSEQIFDALQKASSVGASNLRVKFTTNKETTAR